MEMTPDDRMILQALIHEVYDYTRLYHHCFIPIDTPEWMHTYRGYMEMTRLTPEVLEQKYKDVLRIATENFGHYKFRLVFPERDNPDNTSYVNCPNKVFLEFTKFVFPEDQE